MVLFLGILGGLAGGLGGMAQNLWSANEAKKQRRWTRKMRQTAYQDTMADMQKAGLNPILAYKQGSTGIGSGATGQAANMAGAMSQGAHAVQAVKDGPKRRALMRTQAGKAEMDTNVGAREVFLKQEQQGHVRAQRENADAQRNVIDLQAQALRDQNLPLRKRAQIWEKHGDELAFASEFGKAAGDVTGPASDLLSGWLKNLIKTGAKKGR